MQVILERAGMQMDADGCRRTEADGEGMAGGAAGGSWLRSPQLTGSQLLNSSAMASSLINWGRWIFGSLHKTLASRCSPCHSLPVCFLTFDLLLVCIRLAC